MCKDRAMRRREEFSVLKFLNVGLDGPLENRFSGVPAIPASTILRPLPCLRMGLVIIVP